MPDRPMPKRRRDWRGPIGCVVVIGGIAACLGIASFSLDAICRAGLSQRLPNYPDAEVVSQLGSFGMGTTVIVLASDDEPDVVRAWYGNITGEYARESIGSTDPVVQASRSLTRADWDVTASEDGSGSQIILFGTCVN
ncbi:MAG: hypothetical protein GYB67_16155 [Chloroflexi bacterium]|nr:hypothetical protein [Chloroflexota bacterium]